MPTEDFHCFRTDPAVRWRRIADVLEMSSEGWDWALANIQRWMDQGGLHPGPLKEWRCLLEKARDDKSDRDVFLKQLREAPVGALNEQLRSCSPFVGGPFRFSPALSA